MAKTIKQHLYQSELEKRMQGWPASTTTVLSRPELCNAEQNYQEPYKTCHNYPKAAATVLSLQDPTRTCQNHQKASKSSKNRDHNQKNGLQPTLPSGKTRTIKNRTQPHTPYESCNNNPTATCTYLSKTI